MENSSRESGKRNLLEVIDHEMREGGEERSESSHGVGETDCGVRKVLLPCPKRAFFGNWATEYGKQKGNNPTNRKHMKMKFLRV